MAHQNHDPRPYSNFAFDGRFCLFQADWFGDQFDARPEKFQLRCSDLPSGGTFRSASRTTSIDRALIEFGGHISENSMKIDALLSVT
jgi:hypothetical protein